MKSVSFKVDSGFFLFSASLLKVDPFKSKIWSILLKGWIFMQFLYKIRLTGSTPGNFTSYIPYILDIMLIFLFLSIYYTILGSISNSLYFSDKYSVFIIYFLSWVKKKKLPLLPPSLCFWPWFVLKIWYLLFLGSKLLMMSLSVMPSTNLMYLKICWA